LQLELWLCALVRLQLPARAHRRGEPASWVHWLQRVTAGAKAYQGLLNPSRKPKWSFT
jgi:hypothetical protein